MDAYHIALFVHIVTLVVAGGVTAVTKLAVGRRARARTVGEMIEWHDLLASAAKLFPLCLAVFVITGAYMLSAGQGSVWSSGFVVAGIVGVVLLLVSGVYLATRGRALRQFLAGVASKGADQPAPQLVPPPLVAVLPAVNSGIALAVTFDMVTKPASLPMALGIVAAGIALGLAGGMRRPAPAPVPSAGASAER